MSPKEFQKSHLVLELRTGKKRLEDALHGLSDEQCNRAGATRSGSVVDLLSEIVTKEFVALMEFSDRLPSLPRNPAPHADDRIPAASGTEKAAANQAVDTLLTEFGFLRSALVRRVDDDGSDGAELNAKYASITDVCVTRFNEQIADIERWHTSEIVGFSAARLRAEGREAELNRAILDLSREDFLAGMLDLKSLFAALFERFYSDDFVLWLGAVELHGKAAAFRRMAAVLEPINTLLEMGLASIAVLRTTASAQDAEGNSATDWETVLGGTYSTGVALRWRTVRAWKSRKVIAERIVDLQSSKP